MGGGSLVRSTDGIEASLYSLEGGYEAEEEEEEEEYVVYWRSLSG